MIVTQRERERERGRGRSRLHAPGARRGTRSQVSRIVPWAKGRCQTATPPRVPFLKDFESEVGFPRSGLRLHVQEVLTGKSQRHGAGWWEENASKKAVVCRVHSMSGKFGLALREKYGQ